MVNVAHFTLIPCKPSMIDILAMQDVISFAREAGSAHLVVLSDVPTAKLAESLGYFKAEGLDVELHCEPSWANIADKLAYGFLDAAVILPPLAFWPRKRAFSTLVSLKTSRSPPRRSPGSSHT